ncbi:MAG: hypothetical protein LBT47_01695 [Deltaproteobacteria bacterium]|jgi:hypothetical protein|nr:hypothetical protein [Deltaproteobacteria bacterium]
MTTQLSLDKSTPPPTKSKLPKIIAVAAVILIAVGLGAYFYVGSRADKEALDTFSFLMDKTIGPGRWTTGQVSYTLSSNLMTASEVTIKLDHLDAAFTEPVTIETVEIKNGLKQPELDALLALADWRNQADRHIADKVTFKGVTWKHNFESELFDSSIALITLEGLDLVASGADNSPGVLGFLKSSRIQRLLAENLTFSSTSIKQDGFFSIAASKIEETDLRLSPDDPPFDGLAGLLFNINSTRSSVTGLTSKLKMEEEFINLSLGEQVLSGAKNLSFEAINFNDLTLTSNLKLTTEDEKYLELKMKFNQLNMYDVDFLPFLKKFEPILTAEDSSSIEESFEEIYVLTDLLTLPYSLGKSDGQGLSVTISDQIMLSMDKATFIGPVKAGEIPPSLRYSVTDLKIELPTKANGTFTDDLYNFGQTFGQSTFVINYDAQSTYEPTSGTLTLTGKPGLKINDLVTFSGDLTLTGLTQEIVDQMSEIPISRIEEVLTLPIEKVSLTHTRFEIIDESLTNKILGYYAKSTGESPEAIRMLAATGVESLAETLFNRVENAAELGSNLADFITEPKRIIAEINPNPALNIVTAMEAPSPADFQNSLNATLTINDLQPLVLKFINPASINLNDELSDE